MTNTPVRTRMAPSPTGELHVGSFSIILKNYAFAKKHGGQFVLRVEDTDKVREVEGAGERLLNTIKAYGLSWDEGPDVGGPHAPYTQSERLDLYVEKANELVESGHAYHCFCSREKLEAVREKAREEKRPPKYDRHCRNLSKEEVVKKLSENGEFVIRLAVPDNRSIVYTDLIRGDIEVNSDIIDDQVLLKSDGFPTYHLAVVVDDNDMEISHIMRGEEWLSSTPKHILLYEAFGWKPPVFAHIPIYLNPNGKGKMSKRKGDVSAQSFLDKGYLPEALLNFFMILGWTPKDQRDIISLEEYVQEFDPQDISKKSVAFDIDKLNWLNGVYIRKMWDENQVDLVTRLEKFTPTDFPQAKLDQILPLIYERLEKLSDIEELSDFFYRDIKVDRSLLLKKADKELVSKQLDELYAGLNEIEWTTSEIEKVVRSIQEEHDYKKNQFFMMVRIAVTGKKATPPLFETIEVLGKDLTLRRLKLALT
ncbi:MAG: glutamate--tRNA ligase [Candidatus Pacebacteria bacterium]|nr:glutamate--tRNA ligase [Candidatus Paceibacterota bacterium]